MTGSLTQERLFGLFYIDFETGQFFWKEPPKYHPRLIYGEAGNEQRSHGDKVYWVIKIGGKHYKRGRLMFLAYRGRWPTPCVDHVDGDALNDRPSNLREATITENAWNHKKRAKQSELPMGVRELNGRFQARITHQGRPIYLGVHSTAEEARAIYLAKRKELFGEFA